MEQRRETLRAKRVCRFCLTREEPLSSIYERRTLNSVPLPLQIMACVAIEAFPSDGMPVTICSICRHFMDQSYRFKQICRQADEALRHFVSHGELRGPIQWPNDMLKSLPPGKLKMDVVEYSDEENDEEEQFDEEEEEEEPIIKPEWPKKGLPQASSTPHSSTIKVLQRGNEIIIHTEDPNAAAGGIVKDSVKEDATSQGNKGGILSEDLDDLATCSFPCDLCERSFPLKQLLDIHVQKLHRERNVECKVCTVKFFSKYDLAKHALIHSGKKPYECVVCNKKFARHSLLRRHEKSHTELPLLVCMHCDSTFLSSEELDAHVLIHRKPRPHKCKQCEKSFTFKQGLIRHEAVHLAQHPNKCNYCPKSFRTINMLARHVQSHAGQRPYPCKYCNRSFLLPHHYTRHLRLAHNDEPGWRSKVSQHSKASEGSLMESQLLYKCEQCSSTFRKQDDLIFHSAIHATQNLTCPLCKDKFDNVDDVTEHIKSHAEGSYMCDWCELMFNSEARLDSHVDEVHGDTLRENSGDAEDEEMLTIQGTVVEDEMELQLLHGEPIKGEEEEEEEVEEVEEVEEEDEDYEDENQEAEEYRDYDIKLTADDEEGHTLEITSQIKKEVEGEFSQKAGPASSDFPSGDKVEESEENVIYTELATVDTVKFAQQRQEELEAELQSSDAPNLTEGAEAAPISNILKKAEEVKKQKQLAQERIRLIQKMQPQPKVLQERKKPQAAATVVQNSRPASPPTPKKLERKVVPAVESEKKVAPPLESPAPKPIGISAARRVMQLLKRDKQFEMLDAMMEKVHSGERTNGKETAEETQPPKETPVITKKAASKQDENRPQLQPPPEPEKKKAPPESKQPKAQPKNDIENDPNIKSNERSLKLLERDLQELKKGTKSTLGAKVAQRFPTQQSAMKRSFAMDRQQRKDYSPVMSPPLKRKKQSNIQSTIRSRSDSSDEEKPIKEEDDSDEEESVSEKKKPKTVNEPTPRRSGRPCKIKDYAKMIRDRSSLPDDDDDDDSTDSDAYEPSYSAPKYVIDKLKNSPRSKSTDTPVEQKAVAKAMGEESGVCAVKRGRGRPRKHPAALEESPAEAAPSPPAASVQVDSLHSQLSAKRGRGRPSKKALEERNQLRRTLERAERGSADRQTADDDADDATFQELEDAPRKDVPAKRGRKPNPLPWEESKNLNKEYPSPQRSVTDPRRLPQRMNSSSGEESKPKRQTAIRDSAKQTLNEEQKIIAEQRKRLADPLNLEDLGMAASKSETTQRVPQMTTLPPKSQSETLLSPSGQTLMKVPASVIKSLPPGVKPLPLPPHMAKQATTASLPKEALKAVNAGQISEMKIGDRVVKVQKVVMTKAEVDAMTKKGLLEIKGGQMVIKQGYKKAFQASEMRLAAARSASAAAAAAAAQPKPQPSRVEPLPESSLPSLEDMLPVDTVSKEAVPAVQQASEEPQTRAESLAETSEPLLDDNP